MTRLILLTMLFVVLPAAAAFAQCAEESAADDCCRQIAQTVIELKYEPGCISPVHRTPVTFTPCLELCVSAPCHKPLVTMYPCGSFCIEPVCHKEAVTAEPCGECAGSVELTGCSCQIEHRECDGGCADCADCG